MSTRRHTNWSRLARKHGKSSLFMVVVCLSVIMVSRSRGLQARLAPWTEEVDDTSCGTRVLMPHRVLATAC